MSFNNRNTQDRLIGERKRIQVRKNFLKIRRTHPASLGQKIFFFRKELKIQKRKEKSKSMK